LRLGRGISSESGTALAGATVVSFRFSSVLDSLLYESTPPRDQLTIASDTGGLGVAGLGITVLKTGGGAVADPQYPDEREAADGTVEPDENDNSTPFGVPSLSTGTEADPGRAPAAGPE
jgi:hypothetical protein